MSASLESKFHELSPEVRAYLQGVGRALREAREQRGEDLSGIASFLRIKPSYLEALERAEYEVFPGRVYAYGFLRSYADYLGFDGPEVVRRVKEVVEPRPQQGAAGAASASRRIRLRPLPVAAALVLVAGGALLWQGLRPQLDQSVATATAPIPASETTRTTPSERTSDSVPSQPGAILPTAGTVANDSPAQLPEKLRASERVPPVTVGIGGAPVHAGREGVEASLGRDGTSAVAAEVSGPKPPARAAGSGLPAASSTSGTTPDQIELVARAPAWVQVRSRDGSYIRTRTLAPGDRWPLAQRDDLLLWVGDAGAIELVVDGQNRGLLGEAGAVIRDLPLDLRASTAASTPR